MKEHTVNSRHHLRSIAQSRQRILSGFLALVTLVLVLVSTIPASGPVKARTEVSRAGSSAVIRRSQDPKQNCCGGDEGENKPHTLAGSYYTLKNNFSGKLLLNNKGPLPLEIRPTIFAMSGERFEPPAVTVAGNSYVFVNLADWAALAGPPFQEGSIQLFHRGKDLVLGSQIYLTDGSGRLSFEEKLGEPANSSSSMAAGVWWLPSLKGAVDLVLSNSTSETLSVTATVRGEAPKVEKNLMLQLSPHETRIMDLKSELIGKAPSAMSRFGAIAIEYKGLPGGLVVRGMAHEAALGYSLPIPFSDPMGGKSTSLQGAGLRIGRIGREALSPKVVAYNADDTNTTLNGRVQYTTIDGSNGVAYLPQIELGPRTTDLIDVLQSLRAHNVENRIATASLEFEYTGSPGRVITSAFSVSESGEHVFRVPLWDIVAQRSATGGYPWYIDGDSSTVVYIKNVTDEERQYSLQFRYDGGVYALRVQTIGPRRTAAFDIRALRDQQVPDADGKTLPLDAKSGQINWSMRGSQNQVLIGRSEQVDLAKGVSSNYACQNCCPDSFANAWVDPGGVQGFVGDTTEFTGFEQTMNCYGSLNAPFDPWPSWDSSNWNVASCDGSGLATAQGQGTANIQARWLTYEWGSFESGNPNECYPRERNILAEAICDVLASPDHLVLLADVQGYTNQLPNGGTCPANYFIRQVQFRVVSQDSNGAAPVGDVVVRELFDSISTNTCGNGQPIPSGCDPTDGDGTFIDSITTGCGAVSGPANCGYDANWSWHWCGRINLPIVKLASLNAQVRRDSVTLNGRSQAWPVGTAFRP
ncbi:MAG: hypothetical protein LC794_20310 [Acidobacteria bacterium]|nr:hypothetical protein [Acidobacteriota bacterium]